LEFKEIGIVSLKMASSSGTSGKSEEVSNCEKDNSLGDKIKEENDKLLYLWQRASFLDSDNGIPREISDSLRLRMAILSSYHTKL